jgi:hypothetical protein
VYYRVIWWWFGGVVDEVGFGYFGEVNHLIYTTTTYTTTPPNNPTTNQTIYRYLGWIGNLF